MTETWKTVRIFVSSTFRDMHAERDHLVRFVFPELRERCAKRQLHLVDVDLRWGVTEAEAEQGKLLEMILDEIDRCRPFFIGILGESYGWVPPKYYVPDEKHYDLVREFEPGHSITAMEIYHGVLRNPDREMRAFFYFRDPAFLSTVPEMYRAVFLPESEEAAQKLKRLKDDICKSCHVFYYTCAFGGIGEDGKLMLIGLEAFGQRVLEDLWTAICAEYPEETPEADPLVIERQMHEAFVEERSRLHIGRVEQAAKLTEYVQGMDRRPVMITGESGCGKSAFLASWYRKYASEHPDDFVLAYFIGASPDSTNHYRLLRYMCEELKRKFALKEEIPQVDKKLSEALAMLLVAASRDKSRIVILLDALDQLSPLEGVHSLSWLLDYMPEKARLVVSSLEGDCLEVSRRREAEEILLPPLSENEQREIVETLLSEWRRRLDERQMAALLAHPGVKNPLYLRVALEELRLFGSFEQLTGKIKALKEDVLGLFDQVLARLEDDHGRELVAEAFSLLGCSRYGLSEKEMLELLLREGEEQLPRAVWARLTRSAKAYMVQRGEFIGFFHQQLADAVAARYLGREKKHAKLAAYFAHASLERKLDEYPYQLQHAEDWQALAAALSDLNFFSYAWDQNRKYEWMSYWWSLKGRFDPGKCYQAAIEMREKTEDKTQINFLLLYIYKISQLLDEYMALYPSALLFYKRALTISEKAFGPDHPDVVVHLNNLAEFYCAWGKYAEAEPLYKRALTIFNETLPSHPDVSMLLNNLAEIYHPWGRYAEAELLYMGALAIEEKFFGPDNPKVSTPLSNLAELYKAQGKYVEAESLYKRALAIKEKAFGSDNPNVATLLNNLAEFYHTWGKYAEAELLCKRAVAIREKSFGPDNPDVALSFNHLAKFHTWQGKYVEAESLCKRAVVISEKVFGIDHPFVVISLNNLAKLYKVQGKYVEAEALYKKALTVGEETFKPDHHNVMTSRYNLAELYKEQGKYVEAESLYKRILAIKEKAFGPDYPGVAISLNNLAEFYHTWGKYVEAESLYKRALAIYEKLLDNADVELSFENREPFDISLMAIDDIIQSKCAEVKSLYERALTIWDEILEGSHRQGNPGVVISQSVPLNNLAELYKERGKYAEAEPLYRRALAIREKFFGPEHPHVALLLSNLAELYRAQCKYNESLPLLQRAVKIAEKYFLEPHHTITELIRKNLKACQDSMRRMAQLKLHVDDETFSRLVVRDVLFGAAREILAKTIHENYLTDQEGKKPASDPSMQPWEKLNESLKESNRRQADHIPEKLRRVRCGFVSAADREPVKFEFTPAEIEVLAEMEHDRWVSERLFDGWVYGEKGISKRK